MTVKGTVYVLQSGFVSHTDKGFLKDVSEQATFRQQTLNQTMDIGRTEYYFHPVITKLANEFLANPSIINKFKFRHEVLSNAFLAFNTINITDWLDSQKSSPFLSDLQKAFILETLGFVSGDSRTLAVSQWSNLLDTSTGRQSIHFNYEEVFGKLHTPEPVKAPMHEFIKQWISRDNGYEDLLLSLWMIFGRRVIKQSVTYAHNDSSAEVNRAGALASVVAGV